MTNSSREPYTPTPNYLSPEEWEREEHRCKLVEELHRGGPGEEKKFPSLMDELGLGDKYLVYLNGTTGSFDQLANEISSVCSVVSTTGRPKSRASLAEKDYVEGFKRVLDKLSTFSPDGLPPEHLPTRYAYKDCQNVALKPSNLKPDLVFSIVGTIVSHMKD
ncbi:hypothetical protein H4S04_007434, partial [Coemansia sp. S16]